MKLFLESDPLDFGSFLQNHVLTVLTFAAITIEADCIKVCKLLRGGWETFSTPFDDRPPLVCGLNLQRGSFLADLFGSAYSSSVIQVEMLTRGCGNSSSIGRIGLISESL